MLAMFLLQSLRGKLDGLLLSPSISLSSNYDALLLLLMPVMMMMMMMQRWLLRRTVQQATLIRRRCRRLELKLTNTKANLNH